VDDEAINDAPGDSGAMNGGNMAEKRGGSTKYQDRFWEQLEKEFSLVVEGNKATASVGGKRVVEITATLGTDKADVLIDVVPSSGASIAAFGRKLGGDLEKMEIKATHKFTAANLATELRKTCLFMLMKRGIALAAAAAEDN
jgi:hypothetical protein